MKKNLRSLAVGDNRLADLFGIAHNYDQMPCCVCSRAVWLGPASVAEKPDAVYCYGCSLKSGMPWETSRLAKDSEAEGRVLSEFFSRSN